MDQKFELEYSGFDINEEHPIFYKSVDSKPTDFYIIHIYTPEHFTLLRYMDVAGIVTTHFSTIHSKHELLDVITKGIHEFKKLRIITRDEYLSYKDRYDNYIKSIHV